MDREEVRSRLSRSLQKLSTADATLLAIDSNERAITHRLAVYLEDEFLGWDVDCEYNRRRHDPKVLHLPVAGDVPADDTEARTVFPDIIVHHRDTDDNLLVIEAKKSTSTRSPDQDRRKLHAYVTQLGYEHAALVTFATSDEDRESTIEFV